MNEEIRKLIEDVLGDVELIRESDMEVRERLSLEIMALNAVANSYGKIGAIEFLAEPKINRS